jgi:hypothetical protein
MKACGHAYGFNGLQEQGNQSWFHVKVCKTEAYITENILSHSVTTGITKFKLVLFFWLVTQRPYSWQSCIFNFLSFIMSESQKNIKLFPEVNPYCTHSSQNEHLKRNINK